MDFSEFDYRFAKLILKECYPEITADVIDIIKSLNIPLGRGHRPTPSTVLQRLFSEKDFFRLANLSIDVNIAKILVGKDVETSMLAYLSEIEHRKAFLKVQDVLKLTEIPMRKTRKPTSELGKEIEDLKRLVHGIIALGSRDMIEKARELAQLEIMPYETQEIEQEELLREIGDKRLETIHKLSKEDLEEYKRIIEENNNNNH